MVYVLLTVLLDFNETLRASFNCIYLNFYNAMLLYIGSVLRTTHRGACLLRHNFGSFIVVP